VRHQRRISCRAVVAALGAAFTIALFIEPVALADDDHGFAGTCQGFLQASKILRQLRDPMALFEYREVSERSYEAINEEAIARRMKPLPLPTAPEDYFRRLQLLEQICLKAPELLFREAVSRNYLIMRQSIGLSNEIPK
jgi:hypothetical protein